MVDSESKSFTNVLGWFLFVIFLLTATAIPFIREYLPIISLQYIREGLEVLGYFCVVIIILSAGKNIGDYYLDRFSLLLLIIFPGFFSSVPDEVQGILMIIIFLVPVFASLVLFRHVRRTESFRKGNLKDLLKYLLLGISIALFLFLLLIVFGFNYKISNLNQIDVLTFVGYLFNNLSLSATIEEFLFRGFVLGYLLHKTKLQPFLAILSQALLFWVPHLHQYQNPFLLQLSIPIFGFVMGWFTYKTANITTGIIAHAIYNSLIDIFLYL